MKYLSVVPQTAVSYTKPITWERILAASKATTIVSDGVIVDGMEGEGLVLPWPLTTEDTVSVMTAHAQPTGEIEERIFYWWARIFIVPDWLTEEAAIDWVIDSHFEAEYDTEKTVLFELNGVPLGVMDPVEVDLTDWITDWVTDKCSNPGGPRASSMGWEK